MGSNQNLYSLQSPILSGQIQWQFTARIFHIRICTVRQQSGQRTGVPIVCGTMQRRFIIYRLEIKFIQVIYFFRNRNQFDK